MKYREFCANKIDYSYVAGHPCHLDEIHPSLLPHQRAIVKWAVEGGRRAIFAAFGLGKTRMQLEAVRLTLEKSSGRRGLIICPLGVRQEFRLDGDAIGIKTTFIRRTEELSDNDAGRIYLTNYESVRDGRLDPTLFDVVSLDEAAVLRSFGSKTFITFLSMFAGVPFKFVATATPSPNRYKELIHYAGFLGIMDTGSALTRFFQRDSTQANNLTLYPHKEREFYLWLASWAVFVQMPSDLGFPDDGYTMPPIEVVWHELEADPLANVAVDKITGQSEMFRDGAVGVTGAATEKRESLPARVARLAEIVNSAPDDHFILWHDLEAEREAIKRVLPSATEIYGSQDIDLREQLIIDFSEGRSKLFATKPVLSGSGCNFQHHCHRAIYVGVGFKFADFFQSLHRIQRFGQTTPVRVDIIYTESERSVKASLLAKWEQHKELTSTMSQIIREYGLAHIRPEDVGGLVDGIERVAVSGETWTMANNDTVLECAHIATASIDQIVTSIPFGNQYGYVNSTADFGHNDDNARFWDQMDYLTPNLLRILRPGRMYCCHVKDRIMFGNVTGKGVPTVAPFHAEAIMHGIKHGFDFMGMITVVTDVVRENNQTYRLGWSEHAKDATKIGVGCPEYILLFRAPQTDRSRGYADVPVVHPKDEYSIARWQVDAHAFWPTGGDRLLSSVEMLAMPVAGRMRAFRAWTETEVYDYRAHVELGEMLGDGLSREFMMLAPASKHPMVWTDINRMITLNAEQRRRDVEMHVCPLQLEIVDRLIEQYSNPGEVVLDPFAGIGTVPSRAVKLGRRGAGIELNADYYRDAIGYCERAEREVQTPTLFDFLFDAVDGAA
jgi:hypothetical protein